MTAPPDRRTGASGARGRLPQRTGSFRAALAREGRVVAFVAAVTAVYVVFRTLVLLSTPAGEPIRRPGALPSAIVADAVQHLVAGLVLWAVIQPVRHRGPADGPARLVAVSAAVLAAAAVAASARAAWLVAAGVEPGAWAIWHLFFVRFSLLAAMVVTVGEFHRAEERSLEAMRAAESERAVLEQQTLQARLKTLEAQIEPHFLFNTLANVRRLYEIDAPTGEAMLDRLVRYLEFALPTLRSDGSTLEREIELLSAYLDLQRVRMGRRLEHAIAVAPELRGLAVPPMMLLTLVENAIKHGLAPLREGGRIDVEARVDPGGLCLSVSDTGRGFGCGGSGSGTGLANIRARLSALFGSAAELALEAREPRGVVATIRLPLPAGAPAAAAAPAAGPAAASPAPVAA